MFKELFVAVVAAGAMSVPLAGAAWADVGNNNGGTGGVPGAIGEVTGTPHTLGSEVQQVAKFDGSVKGTVGAPGQALKGAGITGPGH